MSDLKEQIQAFLGGNCDFGRTADGELILECPADTYHQIALTLRDEERLSFEQLIDLSGIDYAAWGMDSQSIAEEVPHHAPAPFSSRFAVSCQLLSLKHNRRLTLRTFAADDNAPMLPSIVDIWACALWYEREAFDLYGIVFEGNPDLRRILTDYGFNGHPFRKDFPISGKVEVYYDEKLQRIVHRPVSIDPREVTPRVIREEHFGRG